ncbi:MAG: universal stress protein [Chloroflexota bacterium]
MKPSPLRAIVVPLDGSRLAECALPIALSLLPPEGRLILVRVPEYTETQAPIGAEYNMFWPEVQNTSEMYNQVHKDIEDYLSHVAERCRRDDIIIDIEIGEGDRAAAIIEIAKNKAADMILMTTHGRTGVSRWIIGSITERVLHDAPCPVLAVRSQSNCTPDRPAAQPLPNILVTLDGSELAEMALPPAMAVAHALGSRLQLARVLPTAEQSAADQPESDGYVEQIAADCRAEGIETTAVALASSGSGAASVASSILDYAVGNEISLIAMSTHGRSGLQRWVYGSVTEKVLHNSEVALLVVRP